MFFNDYLFGLNIPILLLGLGFMVLLYSNKRRRKETIQDEKGMKEKTINRYSFFLVLLFSIYLVLIAILGVSGSISEYFTTGFWWLLD